MRQTISYGRRTPGYHLILEQDRKYLVNVGSVGQPRDGNRRASYVLHDETEHAIEWRRLEYDIERVVKKSEAMCGKGNWCGRRLREGR